MKEDGENRHVLHSLEIQIVAKYHFEGEEMATGLH